MSNDDLKSELSKNITFNMSLGSKELFHSNLLAYIIGLAELTPYSEYIKNNLISQLLRGNKKGVSVADIESTYVWRESKNFDLLVVHRLKSSGDYVATIVELKIKALPSKNQVDKYSEKLNQGIEFFHEQSNEYFSYKKSSKKFKDNKICNEISSINCVLVSPDGDSIADWGGLSLADLIDDSFDRNTYPLNGVNDLMIESYASHLSGLVGILAEAKENVDDFLKNKITIGDLDKYIKSFSQIKLHDLVGKFIYYKISAEMVCELSDASEIDGIEAEPFMSRSTAGLSLKIKMHDDVLLGLQIQNGQFRRLIESKATNAELKKLAISISDSWWPEKSGYHPSIKDKFCKFNENKFLYKYIGCEGFYYQEIIKEARSAFSNAPACFRELKSR